MKKIQIIAIIAAIVTFFSILTVQRPKSGPASSNASSQSSNITVVVAAQNIVPSTVITKKMLTTKSISADDVKSNAFTDVSKAVGRTTTTQINAGEQLVKDKTSMDSDSRYGLAADLPNGMRAVTLSYESDTQGKLADLLQVGNRVDVVSLLEVNNNNNTIKSKRMRTSLLLQNLLIVALDDRTTNQEDSDTSSSLSSSSNSSGVGTYKTVTLAVTPEDSLKLISAQASESVRLILRPQSDKDTKSIDTFLVE